jgi:hypothetical protein
MDGLLGILRNVLIVASLSLVYAATGDSAVSLGG